MRGGEVSLRPSGVTGPGSAAPVAFVVLAAVLLGALLQFARGNLPYTGLWYDEAVQFWISRGTDPFGPPGTPPGGVVAVVRTNGRANLDPGGFSLLLHGWTRFGQDIVWLRALPFGFFLAGLGALARLGWLWRPSLAFALFSAAVPLAYPLLLDHATEVRAYSMEFAGVTIACLLIQRLGPEASVRRFAVSGAALGFFMGSRYSYAIFVGAVGLALGPTLLCRRAGDGDARLRRYLALALPLVVSVAIVLVLGLGRQRGRLNYQGGAMIRYLEPATAAGKTIEQLGWALARNLLSPAALPLTLAALVAVGSRRWHERWTLGVGAAPASGMVCRLALGVLVLSAGLWWWHPWDVGQKWSLYLHALSAVVVVRLVADVLGWLESRADPGRPAQVAWTVVAVIAIGALSVNASVHRRVHANDLTAALRHLDGLSLADGSVAVRPHPYPVLRYLYEHGPFAGRPHYPGAFRLPHRNGPKPLIGPATRYLIAYERLAVLQAEYPGVRVLADPSWSPNLYGVAPRTADAP